MKSRITIHQHDEAVEVSLTLSYAEPTKIVPPQRCPYAQCQGKEFRFHQTVTKPIKDTALETLAAHRYECLSCNRTFRVYPEGVTQAHTSDRVKHLALFFYHLGLSYGSISRLLEMAGSRMCRSWVFGVVKEHDAQGLLPARETLFEAFRIHTNGTTVPYIKIEGMWLPTEIQAHPTDQFTMRLQPQSISQAYTIKQRLHEALFQLNQAVSSNKAEAEV